jgi:cephalosporin hydroxylase
MSSPANAFEVQKLNNIRALAGDARLKELATEWLRETARYQYSYNFTWLGRPIIQFPQDILAMQEIIWRVRPDLIIETGIAHGGSLVFYASLLELLGHGQVLGIDVDIRTHNRMEIERHPMFKRIGMIEGSSVDARVAEQAHQLARDQKNVLVALDSNHSHQHVLRELQLYSPLVEAGSYLVVFDTSIEDMPKGFFPSRPWDRGSNPRTAAQEFLASTDRFVVDEEIEGKLLISANRGGYLKCVKDPS